jgi:hypothetical protein
MIPYIDMNARTVTGGSTKNENLSFHSRYRCTVPGNRDSAAIGAGWRQGLTDSGAFFCALRQAVKRFERLA